MLHVSSLTEMSEAFSVESAVVESYCHFLVLSIKGQISDGLPDKDIERTLILQAALQTVHSVCSGKAA